MQDNNYIQAEDISDRLGDYLPVEWMSLPMAVQTIGIEDGRTWSALYVGKRCKTEEPSEADIQEVANMIKGLGTPISWLAKLNKLNLPCFPENKEPTVKEFFEGEFDQSAMKIEALVVSYPCFWVDELPEETQKMIERGIRNMTAEGDK